MGGIQMKKMVKFSFAAMMLSATFFGTTTTAPVTADAKSTYNNCTAFNKAYPYGVRKSASTKNKVKKRNGRVVYEASRAKVSASIYKAATRQNSDLDRDRDGIACER